MRSVLKPVQKLLESTHLCPRCWQGEQKTSVGKIWILYTYFINAINNISNLSSRHMCVHFSDTQTLIHTQLTQSIWGKKRPKCSSRKDILMQSDIIKNTHCILKYTHTQGGHVGSWSSGSCLKEPFWWEMWYEGECKYKPLNGGEGQQRRMSASRMKLYLLIMKQCTNCTL